MADESGAAHEEKDALLPDESPHNQLYWTAVPVWCGGKSAGDDLDWRYACGFSDGLERGIIMALLKPEWAQGLYHRLRHYYLTTHTPQDLLDWEKHAEETARTIPVSGLSMEDRAAQSIPKQCDDLLPIPSNCGEPSQ